MRNIFRGLLAVFSDGVKFGFFLGIPISLANFRRGVVIYRILS